MCADCFLSCAFFLRPNYGALFSPRNLHHWPDINKVLTALPPVSVGPATRTVDVNNLNVPKSLKD